MRSLSKTHPGIYELLAVSLLTRLVHLGTRNLWLDEAYSWMKTTQSFGEIVKFSRTDIHPPLYYLLIKAWSLLFGVTEAALRFPSVIAGILAVQLLYFLGKRVTNERNAFFGALFLALAPAQVYFSQEARMYSLLECFMLAGTFFYIKTLEERESHRWAYPLGYAVFAALSAYTHIFGVLFVVACNVHFFWQLSHSATDGKISKTLLRAWLIPHALVAGIGLFWIGPFWHYVSDRSGQSWRDVVTLQSGFTELMHLPAKLLLGVLVRPGDLFPAINGILDSPGFGTAFALAWSVFVIVVLPLIAVVLVIRGIAGNARMRPIACMLLVPIVLVAGVMAVLRQELDLGRYLGFVGPFYLLLASVGLFTIRKERLRNTVTALIGLGFAGALFQYYSLKSHDSDFRPVAAYLTEHASPEDRIVVEPEYMEKCLDYYLRQSVVSPLVGSMVKAIDAPRVWHIVEVRFLKTEMSEEGKTVLTNAGYTQSDAILFSQNRITLSIYEAPRKGNNPSKSP